MDKYDYWQEMRDDIRAWIDEHRDKSEGIITEREEQDIYDEMFINDSITGNASGSYTCNSWKAEEYICHNLGLLGEALDAFGADAETIREKIDSAEWADVTIRCYLLYSVLAEVVKEWNEEVETETEGDAND